MISSYAPQIDYSDAEKTRFWDLLGYTLRGIPLSLQVILRGDLNGNMGQTYEELKRVLNEGFGYGKAMSLHRKNLILISNNLISEDALPLIPLL